MFTHTILAYLNTNELLTLEVKCALAVLICLLIIFRRGTHLMYGH
jgi:hypothetical protein